MKKVLHLLSALLIILQLTGCFDQPKQMISPNWDVELNVPLVGKTLTLVDIIDSTNNPNLTIVDSLGVGDSLYLLAVDNLSADASIQDTLKIPVPLVPDTLSIKGAAGAGEIRSATIFNPDPDYHLYSAEFSAGRFILDFNNKSASSVDFEMVIPGFKTKATGEVLSIIESLGPNQTATININLADYNYEELPVAGINDMINFTVQASPGFYFVGIASASGNVDLDFISEINSDEITLSRLTGSIKRTELEYFETEIETKLGSDIKDFENKVEFENVGIRLHASTVGEMKNLEIILDSTTVTGYDYTSGAPQEVDKVFFNGVPYFQSQLIAGASWDTLLDNTNTNINTFLTKLPDMIRVGNKFILDKSTSSPDSLQAISNKDSIKFRADILAPVILAVKDAAYGDTTEVDLSQDDRDRILKANSANLTVEVTNAIALGISASSTFVDKDYNILFKLKNKDGTNNFVVPPADVNSEGVPIVPAGPTKFTVILTKEDLQKFADVQYIINDFFIKSTGSSAAQFGPYVRVRAKDFIKYKLYGGLNYHVDPEDNNN